METTRQANSRSRPRPQACRIRSYQLDTWLTGNIIVFRSIGGTIFHEGAGGRIALERSGGVYTQKKSISMVKADTSAETACTSELQDADGLRYRIRRACGGRTCYSRNRARAAKRDRSRAARADKPSLFGTGVVTDYCQVQNVTATRVKCWRRVEVRHRLHVLG